MHAGEAVPEHCICHQVLYNIVYATICIIIMYICINVRDTFLRMMKARSDGDFRSTEMKVSRLSRANITFMIFFFIERISQYRIR